MRYVIAVSAGTDDPTRATLGMIAAKAAVEQNHEVIVWLQGEAVYIADPAIYPHIQGLNMPAMKDVVDSLIESRVPFWVCQACGKGRNVGPDGWVATAEYKQMGDYVQAVADCDRNLSF